MLPQRGEPALSSSRFPFQKRVRQTGKASVLESGSRWKRSPGGARPALLLSGSLTPRPTTRGPKSTLEAVNRANEDFEARHTCRPSQRRELRVQLRGHPNADLGIIAHALSVDSSRRSSSFSGSPSFFSHNPSSSMHQRLCSHKFVQRADHAWVLARNLPPGVRTGSLVPKLGLAPKVQGIPKSSSQSFGFEHTVQ